MGPRSSKSGQANFLKQYKIIQQLSSQNITYLQHLQTEDQYLLKQYNFNDKKQCQKTMDRLSELKAKLMGNKHVVPLKDYLMTSEDQYCSTFYKVYALFQYPQRTLGDQVNQRKLHRKKFSQTQLWSILASCIVGLSHLQKNNLKHSSLKSSNIFLSKQGIIKIADPTSIGQISNYDAVLTKKSAEHIYLSPQQTQSLQQQNISPNYNPFKSDIWTLGMIIMQAGLLQYQDQQCYRDDKSRIHWETVQYNIDRLGQAYSNQIKNMIELMLSRDERGRPDWIDLEAHVMKGDQVKRSFIDDRAKGFPIDSSRVDNLISQRRERANSINNPQGKSIPTGTFPSITPTSMGQNSPIAITPRSTQPMGYQHKFSAVPITNPNSQPIPSQPSTFSTYVQPLPSPYNNPQFVNFTHSPGIINVPVHSVYVPYHGVSSGSGINPGFNFMTPTIVIPNSNTNPNSSYRINGNPINSRPTSNGYPQSLNSSYISQNNYQSNTNANLFQTPNLNQFSNILQYRVGSDPQPPSQPSQPVNVYPSSLPGSQGQSPNYNIAPLKPSIINSGKISQNRYPKDTYVIKTKFDQNLIIMADQEEGFDEQEQLEAEGQLERNNQVRMRENTGGTGYFGVDRPRPNLQNNDADKNYVNAIRKPNMPIQNNNNQPKYVTQQFSIGSKYEGWKLNGLRHGYGKFFYQDGGMYDGQWKMNKMQGYGKLYYQSTKLAYQGQWSNDQFTGKGTLYNQNPQHLDRSFNYQDLSQIDDYWTKYEGQFEDDLRNGKGILYLSNGQRFEGYFDGDTVQGYGVFYCRDGRKISGKWHENIKIQ